MTFAQPQNTIEFGELVRRILVDEKRHAVKSIAAALSLNPAALYARLRQKARFSPAEIAILIREVADDRLPHWVFVGSTLAVVRRPLPVTVGAGALNGSADRDSMVLLCALQAEEALVAALAGLCDDSDRLRPDHAPRLMDATECAQSALLSIRLHLIRRAAAEPLDANRAGSFERLVRQVLVTEGGLHLRALAEALGIGYTALHARMSGLTPFTPAELRRLFVCYPDPRLADDLLAGTPYVVIPRPLPDRSRTGDTPTRTGFKALRAIIDLQRALAAPASAEQQSTLRRTLEGALGLVATMRWSMTYFGGRGSGSPRPLRFANGGDRSLAQQSDAARSA
ncbi:MAG TPA: hypothetical protein VGC09_11555 [Rhodopila sp.]